MEIKINKEIRQHRENIFWGLSLRQLLCPLLAVGVAVGTYFLLRGPLGGQPASWLCMLAAAPVAAAGFVSYNDMNFEQLAWAIIKTTVLCRRLRTFRAENLYETLLDAPRKKGDDRHG